MNFVKREEELKAAGVHPYQRRIIITAERAAYLRSKQSVFALLTPAQVASLSRGPKPFSKEELQLVTKN